MKIIIIAIFCLIFWLRQLLLIQNGGEHELHRIYSVYACLLVALALFNKLS
jgi:hypothetical protein